jgi:ADP-ribose pyrophosphatase YjhB (NUDIX family)
VPDGPMDFKSYTIVAAIIRRDHEILLVEQAVDTGEVGWSLPGGVVEGNESILAALSREVSEETGLQITQVLGLAYVVSSCRLTARDRTMGLVFDVVGGGQVEPADPDFEIRRAEFCPVTEALVRLGKFPIPMMVEPAIAFLSGTAVAGAFWTYEERSGTTRLLAQIPPVGRQT